MCPKMMRIKMNKIEDIAELILYFNNNDQEGSGLNILTPSQILSRLPISLAQSKTGNNSEKLKNMFFVPFK